MWAPAVLIAQLARQAAFHHRRDLGDVGIMAPAVLIALVAGGGSAVVPTAKPGTRLN